jgi:hypothetical protein
VKGFSAEVNFFWFKKFTGAVYKIYRTVIIIHLLCCAISSKNKEDEAIFAINPAYRRVFFMPLKLVTNQNKKNKEDLLWKVTVLYLYSHLCWQLF